MSRLINVTPSPFLCNIFRGQKRACFDYLFKQVKGKSRMNIDVDLDSKHILYLLPLPLQRRGALTFTLTFTFAAEGCLYGPGCFWPCKCQDSAEVCDPETGVCPVGGCLMGLPTGYDWQGEGCRIGNVALGKAATQSGKFICLKG
jgi:hypothetical protein